MDPGDVLAAGADGAAEAAADEREEDVEDAAGVGREGHGGAQCNLAGARGWSLSRRPPPRRVATLMEKFQVSGAPGSLPPRMPVARLGAVQRVAVDGGGAGVEPVAGGWVEPKRSTSFRTARGGGRGSRRWRPGWPVVTAVDTAAGQVDADIAVFKLGNPLAYGDTVPGDDAPRRWVWICENGDGVAARVKMPGEEFTTRPAPPGMTIFMRQVFRFFGGQRGGLEDSVANRLTRRSA